VRRLVDEAGAVTLGWPSTELDRLRDRLNFEAGPVKARVTVLFRVTDRADVLSLALQLLRSLQARTLKPWATKHRADADIAPAVLASVLSH
jgi:hypothetical protein